MTAVYDQNGIKFLYPENWQLSDQQPNSSPHLVSVQSTDGAFWSVHAYSPPVDPVELVDEALRAMQAEYEDFDFAQTSEQIGELETIGYNMDFYYLDLLATAHWRSFTHGTKTFLLQYQAENRDFEKLKPVFQAMTISLLRQGK